MVWNNQLDVHNALAQSLNYIDNNVCFCLVVVGLGDNWGQRIVPTHPREKELGSQILQVRIHQTLQNDTALFKGIVQ